MKKLYYAIGLLLIFSILSTSVILILSPDTIPAHYNASGEVDRFGSKYENLIFPGLSFLTAACFLPLLQYQRKKNAPVLEQQVLLGTAVFCLILMNALGIFFGVSGIRYAGNPAAVKPDTVIRLVCIGTGVMLVVLGNIMPKARRNALFGLRTTWSMANDSVWRKSQRFGGFSGVICGLLIAVSAAFVSGVRNILLMIALILIWAAVCIIASYRFWKADRK